MAEQEQKVNMVSHMSLNCGVLHASSWMLCILIYWNKICLLKCKLEKIYERFSVCRSHYLYSIVSYNLF